MKIPSFTEWAPWEARESLVGIKEMPGIYLLSKFEGVNQATDPVPTNECIEYIGETCNQTLWARLKAFNKSATTGGRGHSGGRTYFNEYGGDIGDLFVSIIAYGEQKNFQDAAFIRYAERHAILKYVRQHGNFPKCNKK